MRNAASPRRWQTKGKVNIMIIKDFKGRLYKILDIGSASTLLELLADGSRVRIRSYGWDELGFLRP